MTTYRRSTTRPRYQTRTAQQIEDAARQGEQYPCGTTAQHSARHYDEQRAARARGDRYIPPRSCPVCDQLNSRIEQQWKEGEQDALDRAGLYTLDQIEEEERNAVKAYEQCPAIEPAISYICGYWSGLQQAATAARRSNQRRAIA
jgi:hypothetical protein